MVMTAGFNGTKMAQVLGVHRTTLVGWLAEGCPRGTEAEIRAWRSANVRTDHLEHSKRPEASSAPKGKRKRTLAEHRLIADTAKIKADVAFRLMRNKKQAKELVSLSDVQREAAELAIRIKERLLAVPDEMETRFPAETRAANKSDFEEFIRQLLLEISNWSVIGEAMDEWIVAAAKKIEAKKCS